RWHAIAAKHGVICPYGSDNRAEWNHCQPTSIKMVLTQSELRETITANGPVSLEAMFEAGNAMLEGPRDARDGQVRPAQLVRLVTEQDVRRGGKRDKDDDREARAERAKREKRDEREERAERTKREDREDRVERSKREDREERADRSRREDREERAERAE